MNEYKIQRQGRHEQKFTLSSFLLLSSSIPTFAPFSMRSIIRQSLSLLTSTSSPYIHYLLHLSGTMKNDANSERRRIKVMCHEISHIIVSSTLFFTLLEKCNLSDFFFSVSYSHFGVVSFSVSIIRIRGTTLMGSIERDRE